MYSHLSSVDCLSSHLSLKFIVEWPTHLRLLSFLGAFEKLSLYTHMYQSGLKHRFLNIWFIRLYLLHLTEICLRMFNIPLSGHTKSKGTSGSFRQVGKEKSCEPLQRGAGEHLFCGWQWSSSDTYPLPLVKSDRTGEKSWDRMGQK